MASGDAPLRLNYATADGATSPARAGEDYAATSGTHTFSPGGATTQTVVVPVLQDLMWEEAEHVRLNLSAPDAGALVVPDAQLVGTITSNDPGLRVELAAQVYEADPAAGGPPAALAFPVSLTRPLGRGDAPVSIAYLTSEGTAANGLDYAGIAGVLTFEPGGATTQTVNVSVRLDFDKEPALLETVFLNLAVAEGHIPVPGSEQAAGVIRDDDDPDSAWLPTTGGTVNEGAPASWRVARFVVNGQGLPQRSSATTP